MFYHLGGVIALVIIIAVLIGVLGGGKFIHEAIEEKLEKTDISEGSKSHIGEIAGLAILIGGIFLIVYIFKSLGFAG